MAGYLHRSWWILLLYGAIAVVYGALQIVAAFRVRRLEKAL